MSAVTERARKLRANYNIHAQSLRTRIEIRVNRIPLSLRKLTMGELWEKYSGVEQQKPAAPTAALKGPPVPAKDKAVSRPPITRGAGTATAPKPVKRRRLVEMSLVRSDILTKFNSHEMTGGDKENELETPQKRFRANTTTSVSRNPGHALSPTTSNSRIAPRVAATPGRSGIARPAMTPGRAVIASNILHNMVDKARPTTITRPATATSTARKMAASTTSNPSTGPTSSSSSSAAARRKRGATVTAAMAPHQQQREHQPPSRPATQTAQRRASGNSDSSDGSTSTVIRKRPMTAPPGAQPKQPPQIQPTKRTVMSSIKKGVSSAAGGTTRKAPAGAAGGGGGGTVGKGTGTGRVLRKRP